MTENILKIRNHLSLDKDSPSVAGIVLEQGSSINIGEGKFYWSISKSSDWVRENPACKWLASVYLICDEIGNTISIGARR